MHVAPRQSFYSIHYIVVGSNMIWHSDHRGQLFVIIDLLDVALEYEMCRL